MLALSYPPWPFGLIPASCGGRVDALEERTLDRGYKTIASYSAYFFLHQEEVGGVIWIDIHTISLIPMGTPLMDLRPTNLLLIAGSEKRDSMPAGSRRW